MIRTAAGVLLYSPAKFGEGHDHHIFKPVIELEVGGKGSQGFAILLQFAAMRAFLCDVRIESGQPDVVHFRFASGNDLYTPVKQKPDVLLS